VLEGNRFVARTPDGLRYQVGIRAFELGSVFLAHLSIERVARPFMEELGERYGMTCNLAILDEGQAVYIATEDQPGPLRYTPIIGYRHYVHCSALGKALVADLPEAEIRAILRRRGMPALSERTITDPGKLLAELQQVRAQGYAMDNQEGALGFCCLAVPIYGHQGKVAAMSISGPSPQFTSPTIRAMVRAMQASAREISQQLGWREETWHDAIGVTAAARKTKRR
jgi:IclR family acetate operon transcriptional repressor